ncbi:disintegrin and metalloproteinase domain-containing protein 8 isoform X4 [Suricata suricatta]|uniref:disintegrin and metalloproteinase domain-containing protein 8 isoform X4 n=1 Tax=Suricata suricatta TaxID=37032 RepID=UPI001155A7F2|nr:disintegrin and metalloproteinase domain-containing protein 8 isoform X4 [Suricata suricatta]
MARTAPVRLRTQGRGGGVEVSPGLWDRSCPGSLVGSTQGRVLWPLSLTPGPWAGEPGLRVCPGTPPETEVQTHHRPADAFSPTVATPRAPLPHLKQYEVVWPQRLPRPRARRALPSHPDPYPESVSYVLGAQGHTFTLHLRKNRDLVGSGYTETYSIANGSQVVEQLQRQDHCYYQGHVEGHEHSAASLSTCAGLRGFFRAGSTIHLIEPLDGAGEEGRHALYQAEHLQQKAGTCGVSDSSLEKALGPRISAAFRPRNWPPPRDTRFVELYVVTDSAEFQLLGSREAVRSRVLEVVNHVDKLYQELNVRVVLVGLEIWNQENKIHVSSYANTTLENFLRWRAQKLAGRHPHDNAQLITCVGSAREGCVRARGGRGGRLSGHPRPHTRLVSSGVDFTGTTVGLAKVSSMCSQASGAVNQDHSQNPIGVASTMAHEMGHNLGMDHDENIQGCYCPVPREGGGCIMAASIGIKFPRMFSQCSRADLEMFVEKPQTGCLDNAPDPRRLVGDPVCGNRFVERGEQCDCGPPQDCRNPCCNATTCQLAHGAQCAQGACCRECRVMPAGELCRPRKDACDLEEHCDGKEPGCPEDAFQENGTPCPEGYCYQGACPTLARKCQDLWGPGSRAAVERCYAYRLSLNCKGGVPLDSSRVNRCGILYCEGGQKPPEQSSCTLTSYSAACQALVLEGGAGYEPVPEGTKCGEERICWKGLCQHLQVYRSRNCSARCNNHGVCNHKEECQCHPGWAPPHCTEPLPFVPTGPRSLLLPVLLPVVLLGALALLAGAFVYRKARGRSPWGTAAPKTAIGLSNPLFHEAHGVPAKQPARPTAPRAAPKQPPPAPPAAMSSPPFTVPVYTRPPRDQLRPAPPAKPLPELKPKQVVKPVFPPPMPPVKPGAGGPNPGPPQLMDISLGSFSSSQCVVGPKAALKPPVQRR